MQSGMNYVIFTRKYVPRYILPELWYNSIVTDLADYLPLN